MSFEREGQPETSPHSAWAWLMSQRVTPKYAIAMYAEWRIAPQERPTSPFAKRQVDKLLHGRR